MELVDKTEVPEAVVPLSAELETPDEVEEVVETAEEKVEEAEKVVEQKIEDAEVSGATKAEISELRGLLRELRNDNISLKARLSAAERVQKGDFGEDGKGADVTELEQYQDKLQAAATRDFSEILAVMEVNPKYDDLYEVCTGAKFEDIFERVAQFRSSENGSNFSTELVKIKAEVWSMPNPYKYMYETIKEFHPDYAKKDVEKEVSKETKTAKEVLASKKVVTAPGSVANLGGGDETKSGWTSEKIDSMPESQLHTVPKDVYKKWLAGDLD
jgi:vacuolar-type H+-ATPase subunit I/STV1